MDTETEFLCDETGELYWSVVENTEWTDVGSETSGVVSIYAAEACPYCGEKHVRNEVVPKPRRRAESRQ